MKILTANIALGVPGSDSLWRSFRNVLAFHGLQVIPFLLLGGRTLGIFDYSFHADRREQKRYFSASGIGSIVSLIRRAAPGIIIVNELIPAIHKEPMTKAVRALGFSALAWSAEEVYPDVVTLVASREPAEPFDPVVRALPVVAGHAAATGLRLRDRPVSVIGCRLTAGERRFSREQLRDLAAAAQVEMAAGRALIIAGDFNERVKRIARSDFKNLPLHSVTKRPTCLVGTPFLQADLDHIFIPQDWHIGRVDYFAFGSDHLAVMADVELPTP